jgi:hypothetical protein
MSMSITADPLSSRGRWSSNVLLLLWLVMLAASMTPATTSTADASDAAPPNPCAAAKRNAAGRKAEDKMRCHAHAASTAGPVDAVCLARAEARFRVAVTKADRKGSCPGTGDELETLIDGCVARLVSDTPGDGGCIAAKRTAAGTEASGKLACQAKDATKHKATALAACLAHAEKRFDAAVQAAGSCAGDPTIIEADVDGICVAPIVSTTSSSSSTTTSTSTSTTSTSTSNSTTTSTSLAQCCGAERITLRSSQGTLKISGFAPEPFPAGATIVVDVAPADGTCKHDVTIPPGGFHVPPFCEVAFGHTAELTATGCASGDASGAGALWDGFSGAHGGSPETSVSKLIDSSDGTCDPAVGTCANRDLDALGNVATTYGVGGDAGRTGLRVGIPAHLRIWEDAAGCPGNGVYDPAEGDTLSLADADVTLTLTTGTALAQFADENHDGCDLPAGSSGFGAPWTQCPAGAKGPCGVTGIQATGPCCAVGQTATLVAAGAMFTNTFPLYDAGLIASIPVTVESCGAAGSSSCAVLTDPCLD